MLQRHPQYKISDIEQLYKRYDYFEKIVSQWIEHVKAYIAIKEKYFTVRFEELTQDKANQIERIIDFLGVSDQVDINTILKATSMNETRLHAPQHFRKAKKGDWEKYFDDKHKEIFQRSAKQVLDSLDYK
jgi:Asp-tRNA(Asn)/Glu-tRNA(Gln) amidotransferase C subunit